jgi:hypothetical protein
MMLDGREKHSNVCPVRWPVMDFPEPAKPPENRKFKLDHLIGQA